MRETRGIVVHFFPLQISLLLGLLEDKRILLSASTFNLLQYTVVEENPALHRYALEKRNIFYKLSDNSSQIIVNIPL